MSEEFEKWYHTTDDKDQLSEYIFDAAKQAWDEATRQADESWKAYLFAGYEDARPDTDEKGTNVLAHDGEVEKEVKARMRKPLPAEICKRGHPGACLVEAEVAPRPYPGGVFEHTNLRICPACRDIKETERIHDEAMDLANRERDEAVREAQAVTVECCVQSLRQDWLYKLADSREQTLEWARGELYKISPDPNFLARKMAEARLEEARWWERMAVQSHVGGLYRRRIDGLERQLKKFSRSKDS